MFFSCRPEKKLNFRPLTADVFQKGFGYSRFSGKLPIAVIFSKVPTASVYDLLYLH